MRRIFKKNLNLGAMNMYSCIHNISKNPKPKDKREGTQNIGHTNKQMVLGNIRPTSELLTRNSDPSARVLTR